MNVATAAPARPATLHIEHRWLPTTTAGGKLWWKCAACWATVSQNPAGKNFKDECKGRPRCAQAIHPSHSVVTLPGSQPLCICIRCLAWAGRACKLLSQPCRPPNPQTKAKTIGRLSRGLHPSYEFKGVTVCVEPALLERLKGEAAAGQEQKQQQNPTEEVGFSRPELNWLPTRPAFTENSS